MKLRLSQKKLDTVSSVMYDSKFITGNLKYKLDENRLKYYLSKCEYVLKDIDIFNPKLQYYKDNIIINYTNNSDITMYNKILYYLDMLLQIENNSIEDFNNISIGNL